jgi:CheY-like chemotaxis protein
MTPRSGRILVVDDDPDTQIIIPAALTHAGYELRVAEDGLAALAAIRSEIPDIIILDFAMPNLSGPDLLRVLKSHGETRNIPVIACTAVAGLSDVPELLDQGFAEVLLKPVDPAVVVRAVERVQRQAAPTQARPDVR